ncbi:hypothetical protein DFJ74DRAFT_599333, partial [Hyaloraphidium curvatum]
ATTVSLGTPVYNPCEGYEVTSSGRCGPGNGNARCPDGFCCSAYGYCQDDGGNDGDPWCGAGCLLGFGKCHVSGPASTAFCGPAATTTRTTRSTTLSSFTLTSTAQGTPVYKACGNIPTTQDGTCGIDHSRRCPAGRCCAGNGTCQASAGFCGDGCQKGYGVCHILGDLEPFKCPDFSVPADAAGPNADLPVSPNGRCGAGNGYRCPDNICCSAWGYCQGSLRVCDGGCQRGYGKCFGDEFGFDSDGFLTNHTTPTSATATATASATGTATAAPDPLPFWASLAPVFTNCRDNMVAITYDDGPCNYTEVLLDVLKAKNATATFFLVGSKNCEIGDYYGTVRRMAEEGHQIALHTWSHVSIPFSSDTVLAQEMSKIETAVYAAVGLRPRYNRPPFGDWDTRSAGTMGSLGYPLVTWKVTTDDW